MRASRQLTPADDGAETKTDKPLRLSPQVRRSDWTIFKLGAARQLAGVKAGYDRAAVWPDVAKVDKTADIDVVREVGLIHGLPIVCPDLCEIG
jgi:hypothetical protein